MAIQELRNNLEKEGVSEDMCSLLTGGFPNEAFCLIKKENGWEVYYSERGKKMKIKQFASESAACEYMYEKLNKYVAR